ncbi:F0F1 ATP synthase subunit epsilon [Crenobacter sp. SG2303]|uniref:ATP synthase epsilon chain n=1 Tax=Crenobacter oryzisoli TaxID=3056844 RepID=A0ABT7XS97_9NEIS|nr:F0F1 ATP synthase subunit epsilon [Crenobacter sp. SG2303]MDN0076681.1 F0F1 ATP synthase subunit epsilon [Crenobacter sp. SG2303]
MSALTLEMLDGHNIERLENIVSLVAEEATGQFGLLPGHEALITALQPGLVRCRLSDGSWRHLACSGGVLLCRNNLVQLVSARFLSAEHHEQLTAQLENRLQRERRDRTTDQQARVELERALIKRLREWSEARRS